MGNAAIGRSVGEEDAEIVVGAVGYAALTEQCRMAGSSIVTSVERRGAAGDQLDLPVRDGAVLVREVADLVVFQIKLHIEVEEVEHLLRHEAQRPMDVLVAMHGIRIWLTGGYLLRRERRNPGEIAAGT